MHRKRTSLIIFSILLIINFSITFAWGITWSPEATRLTTRFEFDRETSITQTNDGKIWILWPRNVYGNDTVICRTSSDFGETWSDEMNLTTYNDASQKSSPSIFQTMAGTMWLVFSSDKAVQSPPQPHFTLSAIPDALTIPKGTSDTSDIAVTSVSNFGETVNLWVALEPPGITTTLNPTQVTPPPNGTVYSTLTISASQAATPGSYTLTVVGKSPSHSDNVNIDLEIVESAGLSSASKASSHLSSASSEPNDESPTGIDYEIFYKSSNDMGTTWSDEISLTNNSYNDMTPSIIQAQNGTIWLVWSGEQTGNPDIFYKTSPDSGATWSDEAQLTTDPARDSHPSIAQTKDGRIWIVWASNRFGDYDLFYNIYDGSSWSGDTRLTNDTDSDSTPVILQTMNRRVWVFWTKRGSTPSATGDIYYKYSKDYGTSWSESVQFTTDPYEDLWPAVTQSNDHKMWVVWTSDRAGQPDYGNWDVYCKTSLVGDINGDGIVSIMDLVIVAVAYGSYEGGPDYDIDLDLNGDGMIDIRDLSIIGRNYGATA